MRLVTCARGLVFLLLGSIAHAQHVPGRVASSAAPPPEFRTIDEARAWFESDFGSLVGAFTFNNHGTRADGSGYSVSTATRYEDIRLDGCTLQFTFVASSVTLPVPAWQTRADPPLRNRVRIPLQDLDPSSIAVVELQDSTATRPPLIVEMRTTASAGPTITWQLERTIARRATRVRVASLHDGAVVMKALVRAAQLCGARGQ